MTHDVIRVGILATLRITRTYACVICIGIMVKRQWYALSSNVAASVSIIAAVTVLLYDTYLISVAATPTSEHSSATASTGDTITAAAATAAPSSSPSSPSALWSIVQRLLYACLVFIVLPFVVDATNFGTREGLAGSVILVFTLHQFDFLTYDMTLDTNIWDLFDTTTARSHTWVWVLLVLIFLLAGAPAFHQACLPRGWLRWWERAIIWGPWCMIIVAIRFQSWLIVEAGFMWQFLCALWLRTHRHEHVMRAVRYSFGTRLLTDRPPTHVEIVTHTIVHHTPLIPELARMVGEYYCNGSAPSTPILAPYSIPPSRMQANSSNGNGGGTRRSRYASPVGHDHHGMAPPHFDLLQDDLATVMATDLWLNASVATSPSSNDGHDATETTVVAPPDGAYDGSSASGVSGGGIYTSATASTIRYLTPIGYNNQTAEKVYTRLPVQLGPINNGTLRIPVRFIPASPTHDDDSYYVFDWNVCHHTRHAQRNWAELHRLHHWLNVAPTPDGIMQAIISSRTWTLPTPSPTRSTKKSSSSSSAGSTKPAKQPAVKRDGSDADGDRFPLDVKDCYSPPPFWTDQHLPLCIVVMIHIIPWKLYDRIELEYRWDRVEERLCCPRSPTLSPADVDAMLLASPSSSHSPLSSPLYRYPMHNSNSADRLSVRHHRHHNHDHNHRLNHSDSNDDMHDLQLHQHGDGNHRDD